MPASRCARTRALLSEQLDSTLSEVELRAVARHTAECEACRAFEAQSRWATEELRAAPLEPLSRRVVVSRRRRLSTRTAGNVASAAALLVVVVGGYAMGSATAVDESHELGITSGAADVYAVDPLRAIRVDALRAGELPILPETEPTPHVKPARPATDS